MSDNEQWLVIGPTELGYAAYPERSQVVVRLGFEETALGMAPGIVLAIGLTPEEARSMARTLERMAASVEASAHPVRH